MKIDQNDIKIDQNDVKKSNFASKNDPKNDQNDPKNDQNDPHTVIGPLKIAQISVTTAAKSTLKKGSKSDFF